MIEAKGISLVLRGQKILEGISLSLKPGRIYGFQGRNGSGKTMLFRILTGLLSPSEGEVLIHGKKLEPGQVLQDLGLLLENPAFLPGLTGYDNLAMIASIRNLADKERIEEVLSLVGLQGQEQKKYGKYSLGMKAKLGLANVFMEDPSVIMLDEPTNAIDGEGMIRLTEL